MCVWCSLAVVRGCSLVVCGCSLVLCGCSLAVVGGCSLAVCVGFSLQASLVAEDGLRGTQASAAGSGAQSSRPPGSGAQALSCGAGAQVLCRVWDPPRSGSRPVSPARAGRFSPTEPPVSPSRCEFKASARGASWFLQSCSAAWVRCGPGFDCWAAVRRVGWGVVMMMPCGIHVGEAR